MSLEDWLRVDPIEQDGANRKRLSDDVRQQLIELPASTGVSRHPLQDEQLSVDDQARLREACGAKLEFLPRRMFENYLIVPEAIAAVLNNSAPFEHDPLDAGTVHSWIEDNRSRFDGANDGWLDTVHGGRLLSALFSEISETREAYDKVTRGLALTEWLLSNRPDALKPIAELLEEFFPSAQDARVE